MSNSKEFRVEPKDLYLVLRFLPGKQTVERFIVEADFGVKAISAIDNKFPLPNTTTMAYKISVIAADWDKALVSDEYRIELSCGKTVEEVLEQLIAAGVGGDVSE